MRSLIKSLKNILGSWRLKWKLSDFPVEFAYVCAMQLVPFTGTMRVTIPHKHCKVQVPQWSNSNAGTLYFLLVPYLGGGFSNIFGIFIPFWGNDPIWRAYFWDGWFNHQLDILPPSSFFIYDLLLLRLGLLEGLRLPRLRSPRAAPCGRCGSLAEPDRGGWTWFVSWMPMRKPDLYGCLMMMMMRRRRRRTTTTMMIDDGRCMTVDWWLMIVSDHDIADGIAAVMVWTSLRTASCGPCMLSWGVWYQAKALRSTVASLTNHSSEESAPWRGCAKRMSEIGVLPPTFLAWLVMKLIGRSGVYRVYREGGSLHEIDTNWDSLWATLE